MNEEINVNAIADTLNTKVDLPAGKNQSDIDYVVAFQRPTAANNYTWYRLYKSGWVEQGGRTNKNISEATITLPITMANTDYHLMIGIFNYSTTGTGGFDKGHGGCAVSATTIHIDMTASAQYASTWQVSGMAAEQ